MTDYKSAHLAWINSTRTFTPQNVSDYRYDISYLEIMTSLYSQSNVSQEFAKACFVSDKAWFRRTATISKEIDNAVTKLVPTPDGRWFVTIGFNHQTWSIDKCHKAILKILGMDWILKAKANFEMFRENGEHPHVHFLLETKEPKSRILDKLFRPNYIKELVLKKSFIDIKPAEKYHDDYINLVKMEQKQKYIEMDVIWRLKNNIPDYEKNW